VGEAKQRRVAVAGGRPWEQDRPVGEAYSPWYWGEKYKLDYQLPTRPPRRRTPDTTPALLLVAAMLRFGR